jgi:FkbM family methyltransferase
LVLALAACPQQIVDIGANHGSWTGGALSYFPEAAYVLVEPQDHLKVYVQDLIDSGHKIRWVSAGVADKSGTMTFYISDRDDSSTFLPREERTQTRLAAQDNVEVKTLDQLLSEYCIPVPDVVKDLI